MLESVDRPAEGKHFRMKKNASPTCEGWLPVSSSPRQPWRVSNIAGSGLQLTYISYRIFTSTNHLLFSNTRHACHLCIMRIVAKWVKPSYDDMINSQLIKAS